MRWAREAYEGNPVETARKLIGAVLVHETAEGVIKGRITEAEAYGGFYEGHPDDGAHSYKGCTSRTKALFGEPGHAYIYLIYGMYCCMNIVCDAPGVAGGVLLRAVEPVEGLSLIQKHRGKARGKLLSVGPGRLTLAMGIDRSLYGTDLVTGPLYVEDGDGYVEVEISKRKNIDYARWGKDFPWRFTMKGSLWVTK